MHIFLRNYALFTHSSSFQHLMPPFLKKIIFIYAHLCTYSHTTDFIRFYKKRRLRVTSKPSKLYFNYQSTRLKSFSICLTSSSVITAGSPTCAQQIRE